MQGNLELKRVSLSRKELKAIPEDERDLLVFLGHLGNEICFLQKYLLWSLKSPEESGPRQKVYHARMSFILRITAGKLYEANTTLRRLYYKSKVSERWRGDLPSEVQNALKEVKKYFRPKTNAIKKIRDKFAFHFDDIDVLEAIQAVDDPFEIYFAEMNGNCLYDGPHMVTMVAMLQQVDGPDVPDAMAVVAKDMKDVTSYFLTIVHGLICEVLRRNGTLAAGNRTERVVVKGVPDLEQVVVPYYVSSNRSARVT
jgi:hypothetical protein